MANLLLGVIFIVIGNYLPKCRQNYTIGIKLPWTLSDEENWDKTHRFAGKIWMLCGVLEIIVGFLPIAQFEIVTIALILLATIPIAVYSYLFYRKRWDRESGDCVNIFGVFHQLENYRGKL